MAELRPVSRHTEFTDPAKFNVRHLFLVRVEFVFTSYVAHAGLRAAASTATTSYKTSIYTDGVLTNTEMTQRSVLIMLTLHALMHLAFILCSRDFNETFKPATETSSLQSETRLIPSQISPRLRPDLSKVRLKTTSRPRLHDRDYLLAG